MNVDTPGDTIILGTKAGLRIPSTDCWNGAPGGPLTLYRQVAGTQVEETFPVIPFDPKKDLTSVQKKIKSFLTAIEEGLPAPVPTSQIIINQAIIDGIVRSNELGREVEVVIPEV
jgi:predicted dehydrogenase